MTGTARVLIVDDDHDIADSLCALVEARGHCVRVAYDGEEALRLARESDFDIGFLDIMMPGRNGVESLFELKRLQPEMTCYMMTGFSVTNLIEQALVGGALGILHKPVFPEDVLALLPRPTGGSLLIADEDGDLASSLAPSLNKAGWPTIATRSFADVEVKAIDHHIDALILDIDAPMLGSMEVCTRLWRMGKELPTVVITGEAPEWSDAERGSVCHLFKPVDPAMILALIDRTRRKLRVAQ
jgi:two-component system response regulator HydG